MSFVTGTLTTLNPSADLYAALVPALTAAGYTLEDTVVISTRTHKIWKNPAANNPAGKDWYLDISYYTAGTGALTILPMEGYDAATDTAYRMVFSGANSSTIDPTTFSRYGAVGYTLEHANWPLNASVATTLRIGTSTASFGYWMSVTPERVAVLTSLAPSSVMYAGLYEPDPTHAAYAGADAFPLIVVNLAYQARSSASTSAANAEAALTRLPKASALNWGDVPSLRMSVPSATSTAYPALPGIPSDNTSAMGARYASRIAIFTNVYQVGSATPGGLLGQLYDIGIIASVGTVVRGDSVSVDGETWVLGSRGASGGGQDSASLLFKAE